MRHHRHLPNQAETAKKHGNTTNKRSHKECSDRGSAKGKTCVQTSILEQFCSYRFHNMIFFLQLSGNNTSGLCVLFSKLEIN